MPTQIYQQVLEELAAGEMSDLQAVIFAALRKAYPHGRTRQQLILDCFGYQPASSVNLDRNGHDRKIRLAVSAMGKRGIPIVSNSGEAGFRLDVSEEAIQKMILELKSRRKHVEERIYAAETVLVKIHQYGIESIPHDIEPEEQAEQLGLF